MGRDDKCQSVGIFQHRLKKTPPELRFPSTHQRAMMDRMANPYPPSTPTPAQMFYLGLETVRRKKHNIKNHAPPRSRIDLSISAAIAASPSGETSMAKREHLLQQHAAETERLREEQNPGAPIVPLSGTCYPQDSLKPGLGAGPQFQGQADTPRSNNGKSEHSGYSPAETLEETHWQRSPPRLLSVGPDPNRQYLLPKYQKIKTASPQHEARTPYVSGAQHASEPRDAASGYPPPGQTSSEFQHYIPGETYESFEARFNCRIDGISDPGYMQHGRKRSRHEMDAAEVEAHRESKTPFDTPRNDAKNPSQVESKKRYQAFAASVSTGSAAEAETEKDEEKSKGDVEKGLAAKMAEVSLDDDPPRNMPSNLPHGTYAEAARDQPNFALPESRDSTPEETSRAEEDTHLCHKPRRKLKAETRNKNSKTQHSGHSDDSTAPEATEPKVGTPWKLTLDDLDRLHKAAERGTNPRDTTLIASGLFAPSRAHFEHLLSPTGCKVQPPSSPIPKPSLLLTLLPPELRRLIYLHLLTTPTPLHGGELLEHARTTIIIPATLPPTLTHTLSASLLRTCRTIYAEALPILYQENTFYFSKPSMLHLFRSKGLSPSPFPETSPYNKSASMRRYLDTISAHDFSFTPSPQGRFSWVRNLHIKFRQIGQASNLRGIRASSSQREPHWMGAYPDPWTEFLNEERCDEGAEYISSRR